MSHRQRTFERAPRWALALAFSAPMLARVGSAPAAAQDPSAAPVASWSAYGGDGGGRRYSPLRGIDRGNVGRLAVAWTARTGELGTGARDGRDLTFEATPVHFAGLLLLPTGFGDVVALDSTTGAERWRALGGVPRERSYSEVTARGVATWTDPAAAAPGPCRERVYLATIDARLLAYDAANGERCGGFGQGGEVDLAAAVGMKGSGDYQVTSPPAVIGDTLVVGSSIGDNWSAATADGVVRAFDAGTGVERWRWSPLLFVRTGERRVGAANAWAPISVDPERGLVFVATSSPSPDFYGGMRPGNNEHANSLVVLRAADGAPVWSFQIVRHDLWDFDLGAQPTLFEANRDGRTVAGVAQATKLGFLYLFDRASGAPWFPIVERTVPPSEVPGEQAAPTQPTPSKPPPLVEVDRVISPATVWGLSDQDRADCRALLAGVRAEGLFTPPSVGGTVIFPGNGGGTRWGGTAWDPGSGSLIVNSVHEATLVQLVPRADFAALRGADRSDRYEYGAQMGAPFGMRRREFESGRGVPCLAPPWGTLAAVDPVRGEVRWQVPLGEVPDDHPLHAEAQRAGVRGVPHAGGPIVTAGGLVFIAATIDRRIRAFDVTSGAELWQAELPRAGMATPMTYEAGGRQFVVVAAGGHGKAGLELGDFVVAFALPER